MNLRSIGRAIAERRRAAGLTLTQLAAQAGVGRSTLAALESGKLRELGLGRVARLCEAVGLVLDVRPMSLDAPLMAHRHLTEAAGRELTKAAIDDVIVRGDLAAWRGLVRAMRADSSGRVARRVRETSAALATQDSRARVFEQLLPRLLRPGAGRDADNDA